MIQVYHVYRQCDQDGGNSVGISRAPGRRTQIQLAADGRWSISTITESALPGRVASLLRRRHKLLASEFFFDEDSGKFTKEHPDFQSSKGDKRSNFVLFALPPDIESAIDALEAMALERGLTNLFASEREWINKQLRSTTFLVAGTEKPEWALLIAELAFMKGWTVSPSRQGMPSTQPSMDPIRWASWLSSFFQLDSVTAAQVRLRMSSGELLTPTVDAALNELPIDLF
jgi:hypothetical protein